MPKEALKYRQVTQAQLETWLANRVTKHFLLTLGFRLKDIRDINGIGANVDAGNADLSHALMHLNKGRMEGLAEASDPVNLLTDYAMVKPADD